MRLVKAISRKLFHQIEDEAGLLSDHPSGCRSFDKNGALLGHFLWLLLAHCATQHVCTAQGIARQNLGNLHDLFLINNYAIGGRKNGLQIRMEVIYRCTGISFFTGNEVIHHARFQRTRTE